MCKWLLYIKGCVSLLTNSPLYTKRNLAISEASIYLSVTPTQ